MKNKSAGFTLIEVLVALAIISIALSAVIKTTSQNIRDTLYLHNKMIAHWVGLNVINETRAGLLKLPGESADLKQDSVMLGQHWSWQGYASPTHNPQITKIHVDVFHGNNPAKLASLTSYLYVPK